MHLLEANDRLEREIGQLKEEVSTIRSKYDFKEIDMTRAALVRYIQWSTKIILITPEVNSCFESHFSCGICNEISVSPTIIEPCNHTFCK